MTQQVLDAAGDQGHQQLLRYSELYEFPDYVKAAEVDQAVQPVGLPSTSYADVVRRQFPCHTKAACYVSAMFFLNNQQQLGQQARAIASRLTKFATHHGIFEDLQNLASCHQALQQKPEIKEGDYALVKTAADGSRELSYPLRNPEEVKTAAAWFAQYRDHFSFADRVAIAERILDKSASYAVRLPHELDEILERQAGRGVCDPVAAADLLRKRASVRGVSKDLGNHLRKLADVVEQNPLILEDPMSIRSVASVIDRIDRETGLAGRYSEMFPRPEDVLFAGTLKYAAEFLAASCATLTGAVYDRQQFSKLSLSQVRDFLGDEIAESVQYGLGVDPSKMAEVASTLPLPDAIALDRIMRSIGEDPVLEKGAAAEISPAAKERLARDYLVAAAATA